MTAILVKMVTSYGEEHGLVDRLTNSVVDDGFKNIDPKIKSQCEKAKKEDNKMVKARYINHRGRHERLSKPYCRWAGDPILKYHLIPGYTYELPMGFINEVNDPLKRQPKRSGLVSVDGQDIKADSSPLDKDMAGEAIHELVPVSF